MSTFIPAYKDTFYEYSGDSLSFYILMEGAVIYQGKAYKSPSETSIKINVNKIAKDYLEQHITDFRDSDKVIHRHPQAFHFFDLYRADGTLLETYGVLFDWEGTFDGSTKVLSDPVRPNVSVNMKLPFSVFSLYGDTFYIDIGSAIRNTHFTLLTTNLSINNAGGDYTIQWDTDYYPFSDFIIAAENGSVLGYGNRGPSGATVTFAEAPTPAPRTFNVNIYFKNTSNLLGTVQVLQSSVDFNLITKTLNVPQNGGVYPIRWITEVDPAYITAEVVSWPGTTVSGINTRGCTINVPENPFPNGYPFKVNFYYEWEGERYLLDTTDVNLRGKSNMASGSTIDSSITRDVMITENGTFLGFMGGGVYVWQMAPYGPDGYYLNGDNQYNHKFTPYNTYFPYAVYDGLCENISLCRKSFLCEGKRIIDIDGYSLSGSTEWLNEYLENARTFGCGTVSGSAATEATYTGTTMRTGVLSVYSGDTVLDSVVIVQPPYDENYRNIAYNSGSTPFSFSDFKFKSSGYTESSLRTALSNGILPVAVSVIVDGVKIFSPIRSGGQWVELERYDTSAFILETDAEGWTTVKTPLPINVIKTLSGVPATEIWISKNVKYISGNITITAVTYEGTLRDFRNVYNTDLYRVNGVQCSDGLSYGNGRTWRGKSDPLVLSLLSDDSTLGAVANQIRPSICNEYFYPTDDPEPSNVVEITFTGSTAEGSGYGYFYGLNGNTLSANTVTTGMSGEYATATLTFDEDVYGVIRLYPSWRKLDSSVRYIYCQRNTEAGSNLIEPIEKARILGNFTYSGNTSLPSELVLNNLRGIVGYKNFIGSSVTKLEAPNAVVLGTSALTGSHIEELYLPSIQTLEDYSIPASCITLVIGRNLAYIKDLAFFSATNLTTIYFTGLVSEWEKLAIINPVMENRIEQFSNVTSIVCSDGTVTL